MYYTVQCTSTCTLECIVQTAKCNTYAYMFILFLHTTSSTVLGGQDCRLPFNWQRVEDWSQIRPRMNSAEKPWRRKTVLFVWYRYRTTQTTKIHRRRPWVLVAIMRYLSWGRGLVASCKECAGSVTVTIHRLYHH